MRVLLDCSRVISGGALQGVLACVQNLGSNSAIEWHFAIRNEVFTQLSPGAADNFASMAKSFTNYGLIEKVFSPMLMNHAEKKVKPHLVWSFAGPVYWRPEAIHLVGFNQPHLIYPTTSVEKLMSSLEIIKKKVVMYAARRSFLNSDYLTVQTNTVAERVARILGFPSDRIFLTRNTYSNIFESTLVNSHREQDKNQFTIFVPANPYPHKNLLIVPEVAKALLDNGLRQFKFSLTVPKQHEKFRKIEFLSMKLGVQDHIVALGTIPHHRLADYYKSSNAVFLPTLLECSTATYPESFLARVPLATSDLDFARSLCCDAAIYFDPYDHLSAAEALCKLMTDQKEREKLVENGLTVLRKNYPTPAEKWEEQLRCIQQVATSGQKRKIG